MIAGESITVGEGTMKVSVSDGVLEAVNGVLEAVNGVLEADMGVLAVAAPATKAMVTGLPAPLRVANTFRRTAG